MRPKHGLVSPCHDEKAHARKSRYAAIVLEPHTILILIGLRGSGKSSMARLLAQRLHRTSADLDDRVAAMLKVQHAGDAIRTFGEPAFRRTELAALEVALKEHGIVLALGGGTPTAPGVEEMLNGARRQGAVKVVYLRATEATLRTRLAGETNAHRPSLTGKGVLDEIGVLLNLRDTLYKTLADVVVQVDGMTIERAADELMGRM